MKSRLVFANKFGNKNVISVRLMLGKVRQVRRPTLREKCPYSEFFWSVFSTFGLREKKDQKTPNTDTFCAVQ